MNFRSSRRGFLSSIAALPVVDALATVPANRYVTLGRTSLKITKFVFGSMITSDQAVIQRAFDMGVNCFTTARDYQGGNNERLLGSALKGKRDKIILCTESIDMMWRPKTEKETAEYVLNNLDTSLRELQTDYVDVFFLHQKNEPSWIPEDVVEALRTAKKQGKIRHVGLTTHTLPKMADYILASDLWEAVITMYNFTMDSEMHAAAKKVHDAGIGVIAMKVLAGGLRSRNPLPQFKQAGAVLAALKWAMNNPSVDAVVTSVKDVEQLEQNVGAMTEPFTDRERQLLAAAFEQFGPDYCRMCGRCEGTCSKGLPIPEILRCRMYAEDYGQFAMGRGKFLELPPGLRGGSCSDCSGCSVRCAYGLNVAEKVRHTHQLLA